MLAEVVTATRNGQHKQELVCSYERPGGGVACVFDNYAVVDGVEAKYHPVHDWIFRTNLVFGVGTWDNYCVKRNGIWLFEEVQSMPGGTPKEIPWARETGAY